MYIHEVFDGMEKRANEWFNDAHIKGKIVSDGSDIGALKRDLEYFLTKGLWLVNLAKVLGYDVSDNERYLQNMYNIYTNKNKRNGYRFFVTDERYNPFKNKVYTKKEIGSNAQEQNKYIQSLIKNLHTK